MLSTAGRISLVTLLCAHPHTQLLPRVVLVTMLCVVIHSGRSAASSR